VKTRATLILASQSEARQRLLKRLGLSFEVQPAHLDEEAVAARISSPRRLVRRLAELKAATVASSHPKAIVIGSDQMLVCEGHIYGKPHTVEGACRQLARFSGKSISLLTAVCVTSPRKSGHVFVHETKMKFRKLTRQEIRAYVLADLPLECAGSFRFESRGIGLFDSIKTDDPTAIEGLPLIRLAKVLREL
jgi:septum formation protein